MNRLFRSAFIPLIAIVLVVWLASNTLMSKSAGAVNGVATYSQLQTYIQQGSSPHVYEVVFDPSKRAITATFGSKSGQTVTVHYPSDESALEFQNLLNKYHVLYDSKGGRTVSPGHR